MSIFWCNDCNDFKDADFKGCHEDPQDNTASICTDCHELNEDFARNKAEYDREKRL